MNESMNTAHVKVENEPGRAIVAVSAGKPDIPSDIQQKWQHIVDISAKIMGVPTGLITRFTDETLEVFAASITKGNPYKKNDRDSLGIGMFCETVAGRKKGLLVQDSNISEYWKNNPHASLGMRSYMGVPILWTDGELFGTFCMLNDRTNAFTDDFRSLLNEFREVIENDLKNILIYEELKKCVSAQELRLREVHHRIKNQFNMLLGMISLHEMVGEGAIPDLLSDLQNKIRTLSLLHEKLHMQGSGELLYLNSYLTDLCHLVLKDFITFNVETSIEIENIPLDISVAMPIGLIVTELLSNSIKYAFKNEDSHRITLRISRAGEKKLCVYYKDNGPGFSGDITALCSASLGLCLIKMMTEQLGGIMELTNDNGALYRATVNG